MKTGFKAGMVSAWEKIAELPTTPEGAVKTVAGITKVFKNGHWMSPSTPTTLRAATRKPHGLTKVQKFE
jgi:hypothetical protein